MYIKPEIEKKIDDLLSKMTLQEKVGQLQQIGPSPVGGFEISDEEAKAMYEMGKISKEAYESIINHTMLDGREEEIRKGNVGSFIGIDDAEKSNYLQKIAVEQTRLGIPMIMGMDVVHGHKTIFPVPMAQACTFEPETFTIASSVAAKEASEDGIHWTYAPMVDIGRDPRWGRMAEGYGEDSYLASLYAAASVKGFQGDDISRRDKIASCVKHFAAYGACEGGRDYDTVDMSMPKFYETYLPPFKAAVNAGVATVMAAFNDLSGIPCTTNKWLLKDLLRDELGFDGFVISDAHAIEECINHGTALDMKDATKQSIEAGCDMDLGSDAYINLLEDMVKNGEISEEDLDNSVRAVLRIKFNLGLFEHPYVDIPEKPSKLCDEHRAASLEVARKSAVLLKNEGKILPISKNARVTVIGEIADLRDSMHGAWVCSAEHDTGVSLNDGLRNKGINFNFSNCVSEFEPLDKEMLLKDIKDSDIVIAAVEYKSAGEANSRADLTLSQSQTDLLNALNESGKPFVTVLFNGRPIALGNIIDKTPALLEAWHLGTEAGNAIADILFGDYNPTGRLAATFPHVSAQLPLYYNHPNTGRPANDSTIWGSKYRDIPINPLFPFGFGLSYTQFEYSDISAKVNGDTLNVTVTVTNTGEFDSEETVQLYTHRKKATRVRPVRELKGIKKVYLKTGESKNVTISVTREELGYYDVKMNFITDESEYDIWMAHDSSCGEHITIIF